MRRRKAEETIFKSLMIASIAVVVGTLLTIVIMITLKGLPALNLAMITQTPKGGYYLGKEGGILNAIVGSLYLAVGATVLAFLISLPIALFLQRDYIGKTRFASVVKLSMDILWGIPSIVYGAFGFIIMLYLGVRASLLGGIIALTLLEIPIMTRAMDEVVRTVSPDLKAASFTLGATRLQTSVNVVVRQVLPGIMTAVLLAFGRGIGDAASILFTAGYTDRIPTSPLDPVASLPLAVFFQLGTPFPEVQQRAYASALILLLIILLISVLTRLLSKRFTRHTIR
ncbi:MAG: phosphate ABC transporter permease PstA [Chloroflexi bacterium]|nr:phosphate ABC transporter permease PstA [Chloroflexota bacterium]